MARRPRNVTPLSARATSQYARLPFNRELVPDDRAVHLLIEPVGMNHGPGPRIRPIALVDLKVFAFRLVAISKLQAAAFKTAL